MTATQHENDHPEVGSPDPLVADPPASDGSSAPTSREDLNASTPTQRESSRETSIANGSAILPEELADRHLPTSRPSRASVEGTFFHVTERESGARRLLKLYHPHVALKTDSLERIQSIISPQVARLLDFGRLTDGRWWEVQELIEGGSLAQYARSPDAALTGEYLMEAIAEMSGAIAALHEAGIAHHDIKPENFLVRSEYPLRLALIDFGLSVAADSQTYYATSRNATIIYQAPETMQKVGGKRRDWWALGLTIAALATGRRPYEGMNEYGILMEHATHAPPSIMDCLPEGNRVRELCRGLTRYNTDNRWSFNHVRRWLAGDNPEVATETTPSNSAEGRSGPAVWFNDKPFTRAGDLALELTESWTLAARTLGIATNRSRLMEDIFATFGTESLAQLEDRWIETPPIRSEIDHAVVQMVVALNPEHPPTYRGMSLSSESLTEIGLSGQPHHESLLKQLFGSNALEAWAMHGGRPDLIQVGRDWKAGVARLSQISVDAITCLGSGLSEDESDAFQYAGALLAVISDPDLLAEWVERRDRHKPTGKHIPKWYAELAYGSDPVDVVAGALLAEPAKRIQKLNRKQRIEERGARASKAGSRVSLAFGILAWLAFLSVTFKGWDGDFPIWRVELLFGILAHQTMMFKYPKYNLAGFLAIAWLSAEPATLDLNSIYGTAENALGLAVILCVIASLAALAGSWVPLLWGRLRMARGQ